MDNMRFMKIRKELNQVCEDILGIKGMDYTIGQQDSDKLYNFREVAKMIGIEALDVLTIYWLKHVFAILAFVKTKKAGSEPIGLRIADARNYLDLMAALIEEDADVAKQAESGTEPDTE